MIEFSEEELEQFEAGVENIFMEKSISLTNIPNPNIFSQSKKIGYSVNVPNNSTVEKTEKWLEGQIDYQLNKFYTKTFKA